MAIKCCTKLEVAEKRCPIVFEGLRSNFKVTQLKKSSILIQIRCFQTVTPVWIHQWLRNYAKSLKQHRRGALLLFLVIHQISRSHGLKNRRFESNLSKITRPVAAIKSLRFALLLIPQEFEIFHDRPGPGRINWGNHITAWNLVAWCSLPWSGSLHEMATLS